LLGLVGTFGRCRGSWGERRTLIQQMLIVATPGIAADAAAATGFLALTDSRRDDPAVVTGRALAAPGRLTHVCAPWRSLPNACAVVACSTAITSSPSAGVQPSTARDRRFVLLHCGERPMASDGLPLLETSAGDDIGMLGFVASSIERGRETDDVLERTTGPVTLAVLHLDARTLTIAHRGRTIYLSHIRGEGCWFLSTARQALAEGIGRVYGPQYAYADVSVPLADESLLTIHLDHGTPVISGRTTVRST
jgi:hypothetical protein